MSIDEIKDEILKGVVENPRGIGEHELLAKYNTGLLHFYEYLTILQEMQSERLIIKDQYNAWLPRQEGRDFEGFVKRSARLKQESSQEEKIKSLELALKKRTFYLSVLGFVVALLSASAVFYFNKKASDRADENKILKREIGRRDSLESIQWRPSNKTKPEKKDKIK